ncbi:MAG: transposase [Desulfobacteraceae bacterium]|nr:MAG: transposase [Desulfobacteraceae bacterium]
MGAITEIFRFFGPEYLSRYPDMPDQHRKTINAIINCRSGAYGVAVYQCCGCGKSHHIDRSCGNRHCPQCQYHKSRQWLEKQLDRRLPGQHFMLTFTVPEQLRPFCRSHQGAAYGALFKAASESIKKLAKDPRFIGTDLPGFTGVLHTWGRQVQYHPHLHFIVPAGGISADRKKWLTAGNAFYLPVKALSKIFRAKFKSEMQSHALLEQIDPAVWQIAWNVNCQAVGDSEATLKYLAPYIFRVAISDSRIVAVEGRAVTFSCRKKESNRLRKTTLDALEFIRRFLQHVLPAGFMKVRHYGFMSSNCAFSLARLRLLILATLQGLRLNFSALSNHRKKLESPLPTCPSCGCALRYLFSLIPLRPCRGPT